MDNKLLPAPRQFTNLQDTAQLQALNSFLMDIWRYSNNGVTETLSFSTAAGKVASLTVQNGSIVGKTIT